MPSNEQGDSADVPTDLLDGLDGDERAARARLVDSLLDDGATLQEVREAAEQRRLTLLPLERALRSEGDRYSLQDVQAEIGLSTRQAAQLLARLGLAEVDVDDRCFSERDLEAFRSASLAVAGGIAWEGVLEINRTLAVAMPALAATLRQLAEAMAETQQGEDATALDLARAARDLLPLIFPVLEYALHGHLEQQVVSDFVDRQGEHSGIGVPRSVAFADLEDFTGLSERTGIDDVVDLTQRLTDLTVDSLDGRVRLIKTLGDGVMLTAPTPGELVSVLRRLLAAVDAATDLPRLHVGLAWGDTVQRAGDLFGATVNRASRISDAAEPGTIVCDRATHDLLAEDAVVGLEPLEPARLRGIAEPLPVWLVRPRAPGRP